MKITDLKTFVVGTPPPHNGGLYWVFLKLTTDSAIEGYGEVYSIPFHPDTVVRMIEDVAAKHPYTGESFTLKCWRSPFDGTPEGRRYADRGIPALRRPVRSPVPRDRARPNPAAGPARRAAPRFG